MATAVTSIALDTPAADFRLPATDGKIYSLADVAGEKASVIVFICNHCPYVIAVIDRLVADARLLLAEGIGFAAICSNDAKSVPKIHSRTCAISRRNIVFRFLISTMRARMWPARMTPSARRISSASTGI
jgi:peroxiredoxin